MRHGVSYKRLSMKSAHRRALLRNMTTSLLRHERITTTLTKAKELRGVVDHIITLGKRGDLHSLRQASAFLYDDEVTSKVFSNLSKRFADRSGGYTRILKKGPRVGDAAEEAIIELVDFNKKTSSSKSDDKEAKK